MCIFRNILLFIFSINVLFAQQRTNLEILNADFTYFDQKTFPDIRRLVGNVEFKHQGAIMKCDSAWYYYKENRFLAFDNIYINQGDSIHLNGDRLLYNGQNKVAVVKENITLKDRNMKLTTNEIHYDLESNIASYFNGAKIINNKNILKSTKGDYLSKQKLVIFKQNVTLDNPEYIIECDTLHFNTLNEVAYFFGPTTITADQNLIYCENGWYNTINDQSQFNKNAYLWSDHQKLSGDSLYYNRIKGYGLALQNIEIIDTLNNYSIFGNKAEFFENKDSSIITQMPLLVATFESDTLYLHSDTIIANLDSLEKRQIKAFTTAKFYSQNLQGKCQEMYYFMRDSSIQLYESPILWSDNYQLTSNHIVLHLKNNSLNYLEMQQNAFIISKDSMDFYNQIKGLNMYGFFNENELNKIKVKGNGQAVYVVKDEEGKLSGINTVSCSEMLINVKKKEINRISFHKKPNATIFPLNEVPLEWKRLVGFNERFRERISNKKDIWN